MSYDDASLYRPPPVFSPKARARLPYVVLVLVAIVAAIILVVHFAHDDRTEAKAGQLIFATDPIKASAHWAVLLPGTRLDVGVTVRTDVPDDLAARKYEAPDDGRLVGLRVLASATDAPVLPQFDGTPTSDTAIRLQLVADGHAYPLQTTEYADDDETDVPLEVYVPVAGDAGSLRLKVTQGGHSQSLDLRTGKRDAGDYALLYAQPKAHLTSCGPAKITAGYQGQDAPPTCRYQAVEYAYVAGPGWAPAGKVWLVVGVATEQPRGIISRRAGAAPVAYYVDSIPDFHPSDRLDGKKPISDGGLLDYSRTGSSATLLFSVDADDTAAHTFTAVQRTQGYVRLQRKGVPFDAEVTETWTVRIKR